MAGEPVVTVRPSIADLSQYFNTLLALAADRRAVNKTVAIQLRSWVMRNMTSEGTPHGGWAPLKPSTVKDRQRKGYWPGKILQRSGFLKQSFKEFWDNDEAGVGTELPYSKYHEEGYTIYGVQVPARKMLPTADLVRGDIFRIYDWWITRLVKARA